MVSLLNRAVRRANVSPEDPPGRVDELDNKIRDLHRIEKIRAEWVSSYWRALTREPADPDRPHVVDVDLDRAVYEDARALTIHALAEEWGVVIAVAHSGDTLGVGGTCLSTGLCPRGTGP